MLHDVALSPFGASVADMVSAAVDAEAAGVATIWVSDHFSGAVVDRPWSRDPFVCLGAMAARTERVGLGLLVANVVNRHPAQLASAVDSLRSLAPGRVVLGVGSGAAPGSRFAVEHDAIGRELGDADGRRRDLVEAIGSLRAIWRREATFDAEGPAAFDGLTAVVDHDSPPPIVIGASAWSTIEIALDHADGVNLRTTSSTMDHLARLAARRPDGFEVSVLDVARSGTRDDASLAAAGCDRLVLGWSPPFDRSLLDHLTG